MDFNKQQQNVIMKALSDLIDSNEEVLNLLSTAIDTGCLVTKEALARAGRLLDETDEAFNIQEKIFLIHPDENAREELVKELVENRQTLKEGREYFGSLVLYQTPEAGAIRTNTNREAASDAN
ncbi:MAG: hypothetical protein AAFQ80_05450 [Cyanobacteria bacterium J06621_8]